MTIFITIIVSLIFIIGLACLIVCLNPFSDIDFNLDDDEI